MIIPFPAETNQATLERLMQILEEGNSPLPYNPKLPDPPKITADCAQAICLLTSGTTGTPKIAITPVKNHILAARAANEVVLLQEGDGWLMNLPLYHVAGIATYFRCMLAGAEVIFPDGDLDDVTHISTVPTQLHRLLQKEIPYPNLHTIVVGGSAVPHHLVQQARSLGYHVFPTYGMTEMCSQIATSNEVLSNVEAKTVNGEIYVKGEALFTGYLGEPSPFKQGWFPTGDLGTLIGNNLTVTGRADRMFISGGENIQPEEIENALEELDDVLSARVEPRKCEEYGSRPVAYLETKRPVLEDVLRNHLKNKLISWKIPSMFLQNTK